LIREQSEMAGAALDQAREPTRRSSQAAA